MPKFTILSRVDAYVDYTCTVTAASAQEAVDLVYEGLVDVTREKQDVVEFIPLGMAHIPREIGGSDAAAADGDHFANNICPAALASAVN